MIGQHDRLTGSANRHLPPPSRMAASASCLSAFVAGKSVGARHATSPRNRSPPWMRKTHLPAAYAGRERHPMKRIKFIVVLTLAALLGAARSDLGRESAFGESTAKGPYDDSRCPQTIQRSSEPQRYRRAEGDGLGHRASGRGVGLVCRDHPCEFRSRNVCTLPDLAGSAQIASGAVTIGDPALPGANAEATTVAGRGLLGSVRSRRSLRRAAQVSARRIHSSRAADPLRGSWRRAVGPQELFPGGNDHGLTRPIHENGSRSGGPWSSTEDHLGRPGLSGPG